MLWWVADHASAGSDMGTCPGDHGGGRRPARLRPLAVANKGTGEVYLEGGLERGIIPEDSVWTHGGGEGEDGTMLYLQKMNLEVLQRHACGGSAWAGSDAAWSCVQGADCGCMAWNVATAV